MKNTAGKDRSLTGAEKSFIISVSLGTGCYRHIKMPKATTLENLSGAILNAFLFVDDHAHAFFMDNSAWGDNDCYYCEGVDGDGEYRHTCDYTLNQTMTIGSKFKYIFDFGEEWVFACKVLREEDGIPMPGGGDALELFRLDNRTYAKVVREKGEPPQQYASWDDDSENE